MELEKSSATTVQQQEHSPMENPAQHQQQPQSNPLFMLEKACEGIGCYADSSPNKKSSIIKSNGQSLSKFPSQNQRPNGVSNGAFENINGTPKSTSNKKDSRKSPRNNGIHTNGLSSGYCEPSTSSPSNASSLTMNLPGTFPPSIATNGAFPFHMMGCFPPATFHTPSQAPQQRQQQLLQNPQFPHGMINGGPLPTGPFAPPNAAAAAAAAALFPGFANGQHPFLPPPPCSIANGLSPQQLQMMMAMQQQHQHLAAAAATAHMFTPPSMPSMPNPSAGGPPSTSSHFLLNNITNANSGGKKQSQPQHNANEPSTELAAFAQQQLLTQLAAAGGAPLNPFMINALNPVAVGFPGALLSEASTNATAAAMLNENSNGASNLTSGNGSSNIHSMLMAAACGQNKLICTYEVKGGQVCGKVFATESEIWSHFKSSHISQITSPTVTSTTNGHAIGTTTAPETTVALASTFNTSSAGTTSSMAGGGKMKSASLKGSPTGCPTPATKPASNPGANMYANSNSWQNLPGNPPSQQTSQSNPMGNPFSPQQQNIVQQNVHGQASNNRFHPYGNAKPPQAQPSQQQQHNAAMLQPQQQLQMMMHFIQMAAASAAVSSAPSTGQQQNPTQVAMLPPHQIPQALQFEMAAMAAAAAAGLPLHHPFMGGPLPVSMPPVSSQLGSANLQQQQQHQQSQLAALAAMTNGVGGGGSVRPTSTSSSSTAPVVVTTVTAEAGP